MIIYNVTVKINNDVHDDWLNWMKNVHIPDVMKTTLFTSHQLARVLGQDDEDGTTYAIQYTCENMKTLQMYSSRFAPTLQKEHHQRYEGKYVAFRTLLEIVN